MPPIPTPSTNGHAVLTEAQRLHAKGYAIVPCDGKKPTVSDWPEKRLTSKELRASLAGTHLNIAITLNLSNVIDVECDTPEAEANFQKLCGNKIPDTPTWKSKRGNHRLFRRPSGLPKKAVLEIDGIEFRIGNGKGALSVVPPSVHPDGPRYRWLPGLSIHDVIPAELPTEIVTRLQASGSKPKTAGGSSGDDIAEGKRNESLFAKACALREMGLGEETMAGALLDLNDRLCKPPLPEEEVAAIAHSAATGESKAKIGFLARLLHDIELWHDENDTPFATLPQGDHKENWSIGNRCRPFRRWLSKLWYDQTGEMLKAGDLVDIAAMLEGKACFDGPQHQLFRRVAQHAGKFYLDLCDPEWRAVEIDADGWRVVSNPPVKFRRAKAMHPLPVPVKTSGAELGRLLLPFLNVRVVEWSLIAAWLVAALRPVGPYPVLKLLGEQGSAKTTTARVLRALVDPNAAPVRAEPRDCRDLMIAANNGWVLCLDNLSVVKPDLSDALCRLATGGGFATRTLYTDEDETIFDAQRPVILTSIEEIGTRSDLLERSLIIELPPIHTESRRAEKQFWAEFEQARPKILGALLDVVAGAIRRLPEIERKSDAELPRLADFHQWGEAAEAPAGLAPGTFAEAYLSNREAATRIALDSSPAISALLKFLAKNPVVEDTAAGLLEKLGYIDMELKHNPSWPRAPRVLSAILKRVAPNLRQVGIVAVQDTQGGGKDKKKVWRIERDTTGDKPAKVQPVRPASTSKMAEHMRSKGRKIARVANKQTKFSSGE
jgi:hypothetical protein